MDPVLQEKCVAHIRRRQLPDGGDTVTDDNLIQDRGLNPHPGRRCWLSGTRDLNPDSGTGRPGTRGTHDVQPLTQLTIRTIAGQGKGQVSGGSVRASRFGAAILAGENTTFTRFYAQY